MEARSCCVSMEAHNCNSASVGEHSWLPFITVDASDLYEMGLEIGRRFAPLIRSRISKDPFLRSQLMPFAATAEGERLIKSLSASNKDRYPRYWHELEGTAEGSGVSLLEVLLLNFRKELLPFLQNKSMIQVGHTEECSDVLVCSSIALMAHNEDANVTVENHVYLLHALLPRGASFTAFTYAGELPSCAFGFNSYGVGFTLNSVPLSPQEVVTGGIGRNFVSRDLLEATSLDHALKCVLVKELSVGHSYNIMETNKRKIINVETASQGRFSLMEIGAEPFFHANMYQHLHVFQFRTHFRRGKRFQLGPLIIESPIYMEAPTDDIVKGLTEVVLGICGYDLFCHCIVETEDPSSLHRRARAAELPKFTRKEIMNVLGDDKDTYYPIYMEGPNLCTLCTVIFDLDSKMVTIYHGNPSLEMVGLELPLV